MGTFSGYAATPFNSDQTCTCNRKSVKFASSNHLLKINYITNRATDGRDHNLITTSYGTLFHAIFHQFVNKKTQNIKVNIKVWKSIKFFNHAWLVYGCQVLLSRFPSQLVIEEVGQYCSCVSRIMGASPEYGSYGK